MKRLVMLAIVSLCFLLMGTSVYAAPILSDWTLNLSVLSAGLDNVSGVDYISWDSPGESTTTIKHYLGADNTIVN